jgi:sugar phosphate isomerase/epimerase
MPPIPYGLSTTALHGMGLPEKFELTKQMGYDGIEVMVTYDRDSHSYAHLKDLSDRNELPILSIHAPTLLLTHFVWGVKPYPKLERAARHTALTGAETLVVHPPFRWQPTYGSFFLDGVRRVNAQHGVHVAVESMYPWYLAGRPVPAYTPSWETISQEAGAESLTLDFSHVTVAGLDIVEEAARLAPKLRHVHVSDTHLGSKHDLHLPIGEGSLPLAEAFQALREQQWDGQVVAEINTIRQLSRRKQIEVLTETQLRGRELLAQ